MALSIRLGGERALAVIHRVDDRDHLARRLHQDRYTAAYALAQLDDQMWPDAEFYSCTTAQGEAIVCHSHGGLGYATTVTGPASAVRAILRLHTGYPITFAIAEPHHVKPLESVYRLKTLKRMSRMLVSRDTFRRVQSLQPVRGKLQPLLGAHAELVNRLYNAEGDPTFYRPDHIGDGCYWGLVDDERLVAIAGTHAIGRTHRIAILGNVFTHPRYRGRGHATAVTSAVTAALLDEVDDVVLSVDPDNGPAVRAYLKLGYRQIGEIIEASAEREASTLMTAVHRWAARRRSPDGSQEVVKT